MAFHSTSFVLFFLVVTVLYYGVPFRFRWGLLLAASYCFYLSSKPVYLGLIALSTLVNYWASIQMGKMENKGKRMKLLMGLLFFNLSGLVVFKYSNFFTQSAKILFTPIGLFSEVSAFEFIFPLGISFYTFKNISYVIDVYRRTLAPERHLGLYALYVSFFPQLVAGPIERATRLLPQFRERQGFIYQRVVGGLRLMLWGFFQKMVIADTLAALVDPIYNHPGRSNGMSLTVATALFAFQIFYDFSGYSDIAIGAARVLGYDTMANFNRPYSSKSISDFWRRWHISLSTWFRDYLYIPLGGNRVPIPKWYLNLFVVFLLCGLWHGASLTFILWGCLHGFYLIFGHATHGIREKLARKLGLERSPRLHSAWRILITFSLVSFAWIFFRANHVVHIPTILSRLFAGWGSSLSLQSWMTALNFESLRFEWIVGITSLGAAEFFRLLQRRNRSVDRFSRLPTGVRWAAYYALAAAILLLGQFGTKPFIYFQF